MPRRSVLLALLVLAGCPSEPKAPSPTGPPATPEKPKVAPVGRVRLLPAPESPDAALVIADRLARTEAEHRRLVVYVGAPWCEPCRRFHEAAEKGALDALFPQLDLMVFDADRDGERLLMAGYESRLIPLLVVPGANGRATDLRTEGSVKGDGAVGDLAPRLQKLLVR